MQRPLLQVVTLYVAGVLLADHLNVPLIGLFALSFVVCAAACLREHGRKTSLALLLVLAGWTNHAWRQAVIAPHDMRNVMRPTAELVTVRGQLRETPRQRLVELEGGSMIHSLAEVSVEAVRRRGEWEPATGVVITATPVDFGTNYFRGRHVEATGVMEVPRGPAAAGLFDYRNYLARRGIYFQLRTDGMADWRLLEEPLPLRPPLEERFSAWAQRALRLGLPVEDEALHLTWAMALGWRTGLTAELSEPYMRSGTMHLFAISGLHVVLIAGILVNLFRFVSLSRMVAGVSAIPLLWFYCAATGWQASAVRAAVMASVLLAGWALRRPSDLLNSLGAAAFLILLWEPRQLFQAGFQLSFVVVFGLALMAPYFDAICRKVLEPDPLLPEELRPRWQRRLDFPLRLVFAALAASIASWLASWPLIAGYFHLFTPVSLLANLILVPLSNFALMSCLGAIVCRPVMPLFTDLFNHSAWFWMTGMNRLSEWFASLPFAYTQVSSPDAWVMVGWYALLAAVLGRELLPVRGRIAMATLAVVCGFGHLTALWSQRGEVHLTALAAGRGEAFFFQAANGREDLLIDTGTASAAEHVLKPFIRAQGVDQLPTLVLTHGDVNHVGGTAYLREQFSVAQVVTSGLTFRSPEYRKVTEELAREPNLWRKVQRGERVGAWEVLHPSADDRFDVADDKALVLRGEFHGVRVLFVSDLGKLGQQTMLARDRNLAADILLAGTTANDDALGIALLEAVRPKAIVINAPRLPASEHPGTALRGRLQATGASVFYTLEEDSVTVKITPKHGWEIRTMKGRVVRGDALLTH